MAKRHAETRLSTDTKKAHKNTRPAGTQCLRGFMQNVDVYATQEDVRIDFTMFHHSNESTTRYSMSSDSRPRKILHDDAQARIQGANRDASEDDEEEPTELFPFQRGDQFQHGDDVACCISISSKNPLDKENLITTQVFHIHRDLGPTADWLLENGYRIESLCHERYDQPCFLVLWDRNLMVFTTLIQDAKSRPKGVKCHTRLLHESGTAATELRSFWVDMPCVDSAEGVVSLQDLWLHFEDDDSSVVVFVSNVFVQDPALFESHPVEEVWRFKFPGRILNAFSLAGQKLGLVVASHCEGCRDNLYRFLLFDRASGEFSDHTTDVSQLLGFSQSDLRSGGGAHETIGFAIQVGDDDNPVSSLRVLTDFSSMLSSAELGTVVCSHCNLEMDRAVATHQAICK